ncbi:MAG: VOC family protein [Nanoarchaeota archaeon]
MEYKFEHTGITVNDIDRTIDWYRTNFGFEIVAPPTKKPKLELTLAKMRLGDFHLEIIQPYTPYLLLKSDDSEKGSSAERDCSAERDGLVELLSKSGANHIALSVDDVNQAYERLQQNKVPMVTEGVVDSKYFFCQDLDGVLIEVRQR